MQDITVATVQTDLIWESPELNRKDIEKQLNAINSVDLIILPEMFTTGFTTVSYTHLTLPTTPYV